MAGVCVLTTGKPGRAEPRRTKSGDLPWRGISDPLSTGRPSCKFVWSSALALWAFRKRLLHKRARDHLVDVGEVLLLHVGGNKIAQRAGGEGVVLQPSALEDDIRYG